MSLYARFSELLDSILDELVVEGRLNADANRKAVAVEPPREPSHGDLATNAAMVLAKGAGTNPRALAELIKAKLQAVPTVTSVDIAGPGFINLRLADQSWRDELIEIVSEGERYGLSTIGNNERAVQTCLDVQRGLRPSLQDHQELRQMRTTLKAEESLAF